MNRWYEIEDPMSERLKSAFHHLGELIQVSWHAANFERSQFPEIASQALRQLRIQNEYSCFDLLELAASNNPGLSPLQVESLFGDFQYVPYRNGRFYIELLFWMNGTTTVHDHAFSGAFMLLQGRSIATTFSFRERERVNQNLRLGTLKAEHTQVLAPGDVSPIHSGRSLIHSVFHLDVPSITLVVRTAQDDESLPQFDYCGSGIAQSGDITQGEAKTIQALRMMAALDSATFEQHAKEMIRRANRVQRYWLFRSLFLDIKALGEDEFAELAAELGSDFESFVPSLQEEAAGHEIARARALIPDANARSLLAILAVSRDATMFRTLCAQIFPSGFGASLNALLVEMGAPEDLLEPCLHLSNRFLAGHPVDLRSIVDLAGMALPFLGIMRLLNCHLECVP
jgi:hypothetical protein